MRTRLWISIVGSLIAAQCFGVFAESSTETTPKAIASEQSAVAPEDIEAQVNLDVEVFQGFFAKRFSAVEFADYKNGVYALDEPSREQWLEIEEFPPYEFSVDDGETLFETPFANGKTYADCFDNGGINIRQNYPFFDETLGEVVTLELAINRCRESNGEQPLGYKKGAIASISAYMASTSVDQLMYPEVASDAAFKAYNEGKKFFYSKRGQLNFSCADCHMRVSGLRLRAEVLGPALGQPTGFPVYRSKWMELGTLHRRYAGCNKNVRALPFAAQSTEYRNLEYFQSVMSRGLTINGPSARK